MLRTRAREGALRRERAWAVARWPVLAFALAALLALAAGLAYLGLKPSAPPPSPASFSSNLLSNPSFEVLAPLGTQAAHWLPEQGGYAVLAVTEGPSPSYYVMGTTDATEELRPLPPYSGDQCLRLGTGSPSSNGTLREYCAVQRVAVDSPVKRMRVRAACNAAEAGTQPDTRFYLAAIPLLRPDAHAASWHVRLFFTFGLEAWEEAEKTVDVAEAEWEEIMGFEVRVELVTREAALLYCDAVELNVR